MKLKWTKLNIELHRGVELEGEGVKRVERVNSVDCELSGGLRVEQRGLKSGGGLRIRVVNGSDGNAGRVPIYDREIVEQIRRNQSHVRLRGNVRFHDVRPSHLLQTSSGYAKLIEFLDQEWRFHMMDHIRWGFWKKRFEYGPFILRQGWSFCRFFL